MDELHTAREPGTHDTPKHWNSLSDQSSPWRPCIVCRMASPPPSACQPSPPAIMLHPTHLHCTPPPIPAVARTHTSLVDQPHIMAE